MGCGFIVGVDVGEGIEVGVGFTTERNLTGLENGIVLKETGFNHKEGSICLEEQTGEKPDKRQKGSARLKNRAESNIGLATLPHRFYFVKSEDMIFLQFEES